MTTMNPQSLLEQQNWRYAVKKFDAAKKIPSDQWTALEESLILTASSYGLQPWKFLIVQNPDVRKKLTPASWNQTQVADCSHFVVFAYKKKMDEAHIQKFLSRISEVRGVPAEALDGYKKVMLGDLVNGPRAQVIDVWASRQAYIALGNLMTSAALLGVDTCAMEGIDPAQYDEILGLSGSGYTTVCACAVGYRSAEDKTAGAKKVRFATKDIIQNV